MKELTSFLVKSLVDRPEGVEVNADVYDDSVEIGIRVDDEDKGKVIGKQGKVIKAIRTVVTAAAAKQGRRALLDLE